MRWVCKDCGCPLTGKPSGNRRCPMGEHSGWTTGEKFEAGLQRERKVREITQTPPAATVHIEAPNVIGDRLPKHFDLSCGETITSKSQRRRVYKRLGLSVTSASEYARKWGGGRKRGVAMSYPGQKSHKSTAERIGVE